MFIVRSLPSEYDLTHTGPIKRQYGFKTNSNAIQLRDDVEHLRAVDLRRCANDLAAGNIDDIDYCENLN